MSIKAALVGIEQFKRTVALQDQRTRAATVAAVERSTLRTEARLKSIAPKVTGEMVGTVRDEYSQSRLTGYVKIGEGKLPRRRKGTGKRTRKRKVKIGPGAYAPVIDRGDKRRNITAQRFTVKALDQTRAENIADIGKALKSSTRDGL